MCCGPFPVPARCCGRWSNCLWPPRDRNLQAGRQATGVWQLSHLSVDRMCVAVLAVARMTVPTPWQAEQSRGVPLNTAFAWHDSQGRFAMLSFQLESCCQVIERVADLHGPGGNSRTHCQYQQKQYCARASGQAEPWARCTYGGWGFMRRLSAGGHP